MEACVHRSVKSCKRVGRIGTIVGAVMIVVADGGLLTGTFAFVALGGFHRSSLAWCSSRTLGETGYANLLALVLGAGFYAREGTGELAQGKPHADSPSRAAITASATMIGLAIIVGAGGMMFSMVGSINGYV